MGDSVLFHKVITRLHGWMIEQFGHCDTYKISKSSIVHLSRWLAGFLGNKLMYYEAGYWNHHKMQPPWPNRNWAGPKPGAHWSGIFSRVVCSWCGEYLALQAWWKLWILIFPCLHTNILPTSHTFSMLSSFIQFN